MKIPDFKYSLFLWCGTLLLLVIAGCKEKQAVVKMPERIVPSASAAPEWVSARPHNSAYYIGIGTASKVVQPLDYQVVAKKNALNDLSSEISVRVQGQTFLNSIEYNKDFSEEFSSAISTYTDEKIQDYEVVGIWEDSKEYWIYYRLNKAEFKRGKAAQKDKVLSAAFDYYQRGKVAENEGNIPSAFNMQMHGLFALKEYWNDVNEYPTEDGSTIYLDNEIYSSLRRMGSGLKISTPINNIQLDASNNFQVNVPVTILYNEKPVKGASVSYSYPRQEYSRPSVGVTDDKGVVMVNINNINTSEKNTQLSLLIHTESLIADDLDKALQATLIKGISKEKIQIPITFVAPSFYVQSEELFLNEVATTKILTPATSNELVKNGMKVTSSPKDADYIIYIKANTTRGGESQGFSVALLDMQITVRHSVNRQTVYEETFTSVKGLQLNYSAASVEAYKKGKAKIEKEVVGDILKNIL